MCDKNSDEFIKNLIYKKKVVVFGYETDEYTKKSIELFKNRFKYETTNVYLDNISNEINKLKLEECLKIKSKTNVIPMIFINGMFMGNYSSIDNMDYRKDLEIFF